MTEWSSALVDGDVLARQVVEAKRRLGKPAPSVVDLATAITGVQIEDTIVGSSWSATPSSSGPATSCC